MLLELFPRRARRKQLGIKATGKKSDTFARRLSCRRLGKVRENTGQTPLGLPRLFAAEEGHVPEVLA